MDYETNLLNKSVVVFKKDGHQKFGVLKALTPQFLIIRFEDGREEIISFDSIDTIKLNKVQ